MKKVLHLIKFVFVLLLLQNSFGAYAVLGDGNQLSVDFKLIVGRYNTSTQVFTPLALGEEILATQIITVRIIPNNDFWAGATSFVVMFDSAKFTLLGSDKAAFTVNAANNYYANSCTDYSGQTTIPDANWPASFAAGERYDVYKAIKFGTLVDGGAPEYLPGPTPNVPGIWLFQFRIRATQNIVVGTNARIWMDTRWYQSSTNPGVEGYIFKCTDPNNNTIGGTNFSFDFDFTEADIMLALPVPTNTSTITFDVNGGTPEIDPITQDEGTEVTRPTDPTRVGFTFMGWVPAVPATMPVDDVTCVAQWEATPNPTSTITFDTDGGNVISPITADEGAPVPIPPDPTKTGFTFQGWVPDIPATMPVDDMTCVAQWAAASSCGVLWTARTAAEAKNWSSVTYGNGLFVAVAWDETGATNTVMTSPDGINWTTRTAANQHWWYSVTYGNGLFVAVAVTGSVMTSPDGITWTARSAPEPNQWFSVTYGNGLFVAVANDGTNRVMTSPDGITWTARTAAEANKWYSVTYGNGLFVAVAESGTNRVMTSPDGISWTARTAAEANKWYSITYGNGLFVAVANDGINRVMTSPDGITWTARTAAASTWYSVTYGNSLFVAVAISGTNRVMTSPDGITWTARTAAEANGWTSVTSGNGLFVAVAFNGTNRVMTSECTTPNPTSTITFNTDGGSAVSPITQDEGTAVTRPADPTKAGFTFMGWVPNVPETMPVDDVTCVAQWLAIPNLITFSASNVNGTVGSNVVISISITPASGLATGTILLKYDITKLTYVSRSFGPAQGELNAFNANFANNGNIRTIYYGLVHTSGITAGGAMVNITFTVLSGWTGEHVLELSASEVVDEVYNQLQFITVNGGVTITSPQSTITFDVAGGTPAIAPITQNEGTPVTRPADPAKVGFTFEGWVPDVPATMPVDDLTCVAQWLAIPNPTSTISFDVNGGTPAIAPITQDEGTPVTRPANPTKAGFTFQGWVPDVPATMPVDDLTCVAQWQAIPNSYLIAHFKADGLTAGPLTTWPDASGSGNDVTQATSANRPTVVADVLNGLSVVRFDGTNDNLKRGAFSTPAGQPNTVFVVWKTTTTVRQWALGGGTSGATTNGVYQGTGTPPGANIAITAGATILSYARTTPFPFLTTTAVFNGANSKIYENGVLKATGNPGTNALNGLIVGSRFGDAGNPDGIGYLNGDIAEMLIYNAELSDTDRQAVEAYLLLKWFPVHVYDGVTNNRKSVHATIQGGINAAAAGDRVGVATGTYNEFLTITKPITIQGAGIGQTIIDGTGIIPPANALVAISDITTGNLLFDGFTIQKIPLNSSNNERRPVTMIDCTAPAKISFTNNHIIGSGVSETGVSQWGLLAQFSTAEFVINHNTFDGVMNNAILIERAVGAVELGHNTLNVPDWDAGSAIWSMSYAVGAEPWNVTGLHWYHNNIIHSHNPNYGIRRGIGVASAWGTSWGQRTHGAYSNLVIENNKIEDITHWYSSGRAIHLEIDGPDGGFDGVRIRKNEVSALTASTNQEHISRGITFFGPVANPEITDNSFTDFYEAIRLHGTFSQPLYPSGVLINDNNLAGNLVGVKNTGNITTDATCNWWGTDVVADIAAKIEGPVNWSEFLVEDVGGVTYTWSGTEKYTCIAAGVPYNEDTGVTYATIRNAIDNAFPGETVIVPSGTYTETVTLKDGVILSPGSSPGCATVTNLNAESTGGTLLIDLWGDTKCNDPDGYDSWHVTNTVNLEYISLALDLRYFPACDKVFEIITSGNPIQNQFDQGPTITATYGGVTYTFSIDYSDNSVTLTPAKPTATAGGSATICVNASHQISGASAEHGTINWTHNGAGSLDNDEIADPTYTAASGDAGNTVTLTMTVTGKNPCQITTATATYTVTVRDIFTPGEIQTTGETICYNTVPTTVIGSLTVASGGDESIDYSWKSSTDGFATSSTIAGAVSPTYTPGTLTQTTSYRRYANDGVCNTDPMASAGTWTITVEPTPVSGSFAKNPDFVYVCSSDIVSATFTSGSGGNGTDKLQYRTFNGTTWTNWAEYASGNEIAATGLHEIQIQTWRDADYCEPSGVVSETWLVDVTPPSVTAKTNIVYLEANGTYTLQNSDVLVLPLETGASVVSITPGQVTCAQLGTPVTVAVVVKDLCNNQTTVNANITIQEGSSLGDWISCITHSSAGGNATYSPCTNDGTFMLSATGQSTTTQDVHRFVYKTIGTTGTVIARLADVENGGYAGVMMRKSCEPNAPAIYFKTLLYNPNVLIGTRTTQGQAMRNASQVAQLIRWMKIQRNGTNFRVFTSYNGTTWQQRYSGTINMTGSIQAGIFTESVRSNRTSIAWFDHVEVVDFLKTDDLITIADQDQKNTENLDILIFPNPADERITIVYPYTGNPVKLTISNPEGQQVISEIIRESETQINLQSLRPGIWFLRFESEERVEIRKLIIQ